MNIVGIKEMSRFDAYCEYCDSTPERLYFPFTSTTLSPAHVCEKCAREHTIVGWFGTQLEYYRALANYKRVTARMDKYSKQVTKQEALDLFNEVKNTYNAATPKELIDKFKNGEYTIPGELISIIRILVDV